MTKWSVQKQIHKISQKAKRTNTQQTLRIFLKDDKHVRIFKIIFNCTAKQTSRK